MPTSPSRRAFLKILLATGFGVGCSHRREGWPDASPISPDASSIDASIDTDAGEPVTCLCASPNTGTAGRIVTLGGGDGVHQSFALIPPNTFDSRLRYPLALNLHHVGGTSADAADLVPQLKSLYDGCFIIAPLGSLNDATNTWWNSGVSMNHYNQVTNDYEYLIGIVRAVMAQWPIDRHNVWTIGYSNGACMAQGMALRNPDLFTACVSIAGTMPDDTGDSFRPLISPVHYLAVHGSIDATVKYTGGPGGYPSTVYPGAVATAAIWATLNGVGGTLQAPYDSVDIASGVAGNETDRQAYSGAPANGAVELWTMNGIGHTLSMNDNWRILAAQWLRAHPRV